ncbi:hypothetical protein IX51_05985 [uncultured archaeon]|nr:hypothetical protein IX51_05985 [uncultured archaeon]
MEESDRSLKFALLIDAENAEHKLIDSVVDEIGKYGEVVIRRIYGDFTIQSMSPWNRVILEKAFSPVLQIHNLSGKNSSDFAMVIDAMDILYNNEIDAFCLVSSDSDFTRLVLRLKESGKFVLGIGRNITSSSLVNACNVFVYTDNLTKAEKDVKVILEESPRSKEKNREIIDQLLRAYEMCEKDEEKAYLTCIGESVRKINPGFDQRSFGFKKLTDLVRNLPDIFSLEDIREDGSKSAIYMVRRVQKKKRPKKKTHKN